MSTATIVMIILAVGLVVLIGWVIGAYNSLVQLKHNVDKAWSNIDVLLKQRHDEIPKLVKVCERYMQHERETLERVIQARNAAAAADSIAGKASAEGALGGLLGKLFALVESYPDLKANQGFLSLQSRVSSLEDQIADRRELYNESVNLINVRIEQFPDVLVARPMSFTARELFKANAGDREDVEIQFS
jgi:LemA protein